MASVMVPFRGTIGGDYRAKPAGLVVATAAPPAQIRPMEASEFITALVLLDWTLAEAADRLSYARSTVRKWASGHAKVPDEVATWLRPYAAEIAAAHAKHPWPQRVGQPGRP